jgi:ABC-type transport system involved in multi-copper enzyme maturation permease subunit
MDNKNSWKNPLLIAGIGLIAILIYALVGTQGHLDAITLGVVFLIQSLLSFFLAVGQLISTRFKKDGLKQMLIAGVLLLIGFGVCSQVSLNVH